MMEGVSNRRRRRAPGPVNGIPGHSFRYQRLIEAFLDSGGFWFPMRATSGTIAKNYGYKAGIGDQLFGNSGVINGMGTPITFTSDNPDIWVSGGESGDDPEISEVAAGEGHADSPTPGGGLLNIFTGAIGTPIGMSQNVQTTGDTYRKVMAINRVVSGSVIWAAGGSGGANIGSALSSAGVHTHDHIATTVALGMKRGGANTDVTIQGYKAYKIGEKDGLIAGTTSLGQTGLRGPNEAFLFDGATSLITVTNVAVLQGLTEFSLWMLFKPSSAGEGNAGVMFVKSGEWAFQFAAATRTLYAVMVNATTNAETITTTTVPADVWSTVGLSYSHSGDKLPHIYVNGVEAAYSGTRIAGVGNRTGNTNNIGVGNTTSASATLAGLIDEALLVKRALSAQDFALLHTLATGMPPGVAA